MELASQTHQHLPGRGSFVVASLLPLSVLLQPSLNVRRDVAARFEHVDQSRTDLAPVPERVPVNVQVTAIPVEEPDEIAAAPDK